MQQHNTLQSLSHDIVYYMHNYKDKHYGLLFPSSVYYGGHAFNISVKPKDMITTRDVDIFMGWDTKLVPFLSSNYEAKITKSWSESGRP